MYIYFWVSLREVKNTSNYVHKKKSCVVSYKMSTHVALCVKICQHRDGKKLYDCSQATHISEARVNLDSISLSC
jgi:hypothetical protein